MIRNLVTVKSLAAVAALLLVFSTAETLKAATSPAEKQSLWGAGYFPNVSLVTQDGKTVRFYDDLMKDKKVLIDFIYASCQQICPLQTAKLAQVQKAFGPRIGRDIFMYSISLDPEHDTPAVLKAYAAKFGARPGWVFLTGKRADIDLVRDKLGERGAKEGHGNDVRVGDVDRGQWMRLPLTAEANYLVNEIGKTFDPVWYSGKGAKSIEDAPRRVISAKDRDLFQGQSLFDNRCAACHTIGAGDRIGPDLKGVATRREHAWLARYIAAPDKMRAGKDAIAMELAKTHKVSMPNLGLAAIDVAELIHYLEVRTADLEGQDKEKETKSTTAP